VRDTFWAELLRTAPKSVATLQIWLGRMHLVFRGQRSASAKSVPAVWSRHG
jgi:hypothetical protein